MNSLEEDLTYERKMDNISEQIEELLLDAMLLALRKSRKEIVSLLNQRINIRMSLTHFKENQGRSK